MSAPFRSAGKQILLNNEHFADCVTDLAAMHTASSLNNSFPRDHRPKMEEFKHL